MAVAVKEDEQDEKNTNRYKSDDEDIFLIQWTLFEMSYADKDKIADITDRKKVQNQR